MIIWSMIVVVYYCMVYGCVSKIVGLLLCGLVVYDCMVYGCVSKIVGLGLCGL